MIEGMKVLAANKMDWKHPRSGGVEKNLRETLSRLSDRGHEVHLLSAKFPGSSDRETSEGVHIHRYGVEGRTNELYILSIGQLHLNSLITELEPDAVYTVNSLMAWFPVKKRDSHIVGIHHLNGKAIMDQLAFPANLLGYISEKIGVLLSRGKKILTVSPSTRKTIERYGIERENVEVAPNGVKTEAYRPGEEASKPTVLYLGRLEHTKGADLIPEIHEKIKRIHGDYRLEIAGFGRMEDELARFAEREDSVTFHGYVSEERKRELLSEAWVSISPSRREGWDITVSEAAASGTPTVGFAKGGLTDSINDHETGILVPANPDLETHLGDFSQEVASLLEDGSRREELGKNARFEAGSLSWERATDKLESLLLEVKDGGN